jgi:GTPase
VGRPNAGKSTLTNAMVGEKVAITSDRPQTTRHTVRGIVHRPDAQLILVDTPGLHRPRTLLGQRLNDVVRETLTEVDVIGFCVPADQRVGPGDKFIATEIAQLRPPKVAIVTKTDRVDKKTVAEQLLGVSALADFAEVIPVSAMVGDQVGEEMAAREDRPPDRPLVDISAILYVERDSQKAIVIGKGGERLRRVGSRSRVQIEKLLGTPVYLDLRVKVAKDWQRDPKQLRRLGF